MNFPSEFFRTPFFGEAKQLKNRPTNDWLPPPSSPKKTRNMYIYIYNYMYIHLYSWNTTNPPKQIVIWYDTVPSWHKNLRALHFLGSWSPLHHTESQHQKASPEPGGNFCVVVVFHTWKVDLEFRNLRSSAKCLDLFADHIDTTGNRLDLPSFLLYG